MRMDQVSETVSKPVVRVALVMESFHSTRIVTKTMGILCILLTDGYVQTHMYEIYRAFLFHCLFKREPRRTLVACGCSVAVL